METNPRKQQLSCPCRHPPRPGLAWRTCSPPPRAARLQVHQLICDNRWPLCGHSPRRGLASRTRSLPRRRAPPPPRISHRETQRPAGRSAPPLLRNPLPPRRRPLHPATVVWPLQLRACGNQTVMHRRCNTQNCLCLDGGGLLVPQPLDGRCSRHDSRQSNAIPHCIGDALPRRLVGITA